MAFKMFILQGGVCGSSFCIREVTFLTGIGSMQHHAAASLPASLRTSGLCSREAVVAFDLKLMAYWKLQFCCFMAILVASFLVSWLTV